MKRFAAVASVLLFTLAASAHNFIPVDSIDAKALIPSPPAADSLEQKAELTVLYQLQVNRTPAQIKRAHEIQDEDLFSFCRDVLGDWFTRENLPKTVEFFKAAGDDFYAINRASKSLWNRTRPAFADERIKPCVETSNSPSYPSGHGIQAGMWAVLLTKLFPDHSEQIHARAAETGWYRLIGGAHFPTDIEAGRILGEAIAHRLLEEKKFLQGLEEVRAEVTPFLTQKAA